MIEILTAAQVDRARRTGALVADILRSLRERSLVGTNLLDLDRWTAEMIREAGAESCYVDYAPSFGRGPFGHYVCTAVNDAVLHGRPRDQRLADGDLLTLDLAVRLDGVAADSAISFVVGESRPAGSVEMIETTERALAAGIAAAGPGARIGDLSHAIGTRAPRRRLPDQHAVRRPRHRHDDAPGPARLQRRPPRSRLQAPAGPAAGAGAVDHGRHRRAGHRRRRLDAAQRHRLPHRAQRAHHRDHRGRCGDPDPAVVLTG